MMKNILSDNENHFFALEFYIGHQVCVQTQVYFNCHLLAVIDQSQWISTQLFYS